MGESMASATALHQVGKAPATSCIWWIISQWKKHLFLSAITLLSLQSFPICWPGSLKHSLWTVLLMCCCSLWFHHKVYKLCSSSRSEGGGTQGLIHNLPLLIKPNLLISYGWVPFPSPLHQPQTFFLIIGNYETPFPLAQCQTVWDTKKQ